MLYASLLILFSLTTLHKLVYSQLVGLSCSVDQSGLPGICKLLIDCPLVRDDIIKNQRRPQICGFRETQSIVCCPKVKKPGDISKAKCKEYSAYAGKECGIHRIVKRIVGGTTVGDKEFAHMALLGFQGIDGSVSWQCGGTIISEEYILTVAHCLIRSRFSRKNELKYVRLGIININDTEHRQELRVAATIVHPEYKLAVRYNDIGLIKLEKPIQFNSYVRPACLYSDYLISAEKAVAIGWGRTEFASGSLSDILLKVTLDLVSYEFCNMTYKSAISKNFNGIRDDSQICAGSGKDGKDTCVGDTGGALQIVHEDDDISCMYDVVGIISFGKGCGISPGVYTRVSYYIDWIEKIVWPEK